MYISYLREFTFQYKNGYIMEVNLANIGRKAIVKKRFVRGCCQSSGNKGWAALNRLVEETVSSLNTSPISPLQKSLHVDVHSLPTLFFNRYISFDGISSLKSAFINNNSANIFNTCVVLFTFAVETTCLFEPSNILLLFYRLF